jgi:acetylornithine deacetylase/succinyl-diaminopimelate desuccinylase-like protein
MTLFETLKRILRSADPDGEPIPILLPRATDARFFSKLGIQTYGYLPMKLPPEFHFSHLIHGPDERIPVDALTFGTEAIYQLMHRFGQ